MLAELSHVQSARGEKVTSTLLIARHLHMNGTQRLAISTKTNFSLVVVFCMFASRK